MALALLFAAPVAGALETIDFETLAGGTCDASGDIEVAAGACGSVFLRGFNPALGAVNAACIYDSDCPGGCTGGDVDLGSPNETCPGGGPGMGADGEVGEPNENCTALGKLAAVCTVLTDPEPDGICSNPNDAAAIGTSLTLDFSAIGPVTVHELTIIDIGDNELGQNVELEQSDATVLAFPFPSAGDNGVAVVPLGPTSDVVSLTMNPQGSGAMDNVVIECTTTTTTSSTSTSSSSSSTTSSTSSTTSTSVSTSSSSTTSTAPTTSTTSSSTSSSTTTSTSVTTSTTSTTTSIPTTTSTSSTSTTSTTVPHQVCNCDDVAFLVNRRGKFNNDGLIDGNIGANDPFGLIRFGKNTFMEDGTSVRATTVKIGDGSSVWDAFATQLGLGNGATVRNQTGPVTLPLVDPFCALEPIACSDDDLVVQPGDPVTPLAPGVYGKLRIRNDGVLRLEPDGEYTFCDVKMGRASVLSGPTRATIAIERRIKIGAGSFVGTDDDTLLTLDVAGSKVRISQGAVVEAAITVPDGKFKIQRDGTLIGCFCADLSTTDKHVTLTCQASPGGAFID